VYRCEIANSPRNGISYQDASESKWHGMELAFELFFFQQQRPPANCLPRLFRHAAMGAVTIESPILERTPLETPSGPSIFARVGWSVSGYGRDA
jgi:hypothetical protein